MALINCYECGKEISDKAKACPHCGAPSEISKDNEKVDLISKLKNGKKSLKPLNDTKPQPTLHPETTENKQKPGCLFTMGILFFPYIFSWFTLGKRYSSRAKTLSFVWLGFFVFVYIIGFIGEAYNKYNKNNETVVEKRNENININPEVVVMTYIKQNVNDPSSLEIESLQANSRGDNEWDVIGVFRAKNGFGATMKYRKHFIVKNGIVIAHE